MNNQNSVGTAPGTITLMMPNGLVYALQDWIDDKLYSTVEWQNGDAQPLSAMISGLSAVITGGARSNTEVDTNVPKDGNAGLPKDYQFHVYGWGIKLVRATRVTPPATTITDLSTFSDPVALRTFFEIDRRLFFQYVYNRKEYTEGVIQDYPQGHGIYLVTTQTATEIAQNGIPSPRDRVALVLPVIHRENLDFKGLFRPMIALSIAQPASDGGADLPVVDMKLYSYGLLQRTVR